MVLKKNPIQLHPLLMLAIFILTVGSFSCRTNSLGAAQQITVQPEKKSARMTDACNAFGIDLYKKIRKADDNENLLISPLSISAALAATYNGAEGETRSEMGKAMNLQEITDEQLNTSYSALIAELKPVDSEVVFEIANAVFHAKRFPVKENFKTINEKVFNATVQGLEFESPSAVETINNWVKDKTSGKIENILQQLNPLDRMVLLNAVYFYGSWQQAFRENGTQLREFYFPDGSNKRVPLMNKMDTLPYYDANIFSAIKLPYGNGTFNMVVLLPDIRHTLTDVAGILSAKYWNELMSKFELTERVDVIFPRFKFEYETSLTEVLPEMGMKTAFLPKSADFSGISEEELYISEVKHKTFIDVNETGTEAAAVTSVGFATTSMREEPPTVPFYVNRPFIFAITEAVSGAILFIGEVKNPEY